MKSVIIKTLEKINSDGLIWISLVVLFGAIFTFGTIRIGQATGKQVSILLNRITSKITVVHHPGSKKLMASPPSK